MIKDSYKKVFGDKERVLVVFAHPDDAEIYCGATIARLTSDGKRVRVIKMSSGNKGSRQENISEEDLRELRVREDSTAMDVLGIQPQDNIYLDLGDGQIENDLNTIEKLARHIREFKPDIIITHNPEDVIIRFDEGVNWVNHRDHRNTGKSVIDAAYPYSRDILFFPHHIEKESLSSHTVTEFLIVDSYNHEDEVFIGVHQQVETRLKAIASHASQYSVEDAQDSTDFFTNVDGDIGSWERFRYVVAD